MTNNRHFKKGRGVFECSACGKQTRDTGANDGVDLCPLCNAKAECGNTLSDNTELDNPWATLAPCTTVDEVYSLCDKLMQEAR